MDKDVWKVIFCQRGDDWYWSLRVMGKQGKVKEKQGNAGKTRKNQGNERKPYCPCANDSNDVDNTTVMRLENQKDA